MAQYFYQALTKEGKKVSGTVDASGEANVREILARQGIFPTKIEQSAGKRGFSLSKLFSRGVSVKEKMLFTKQLAVLLRSGVPLLQALELLSEQFTGRMQTIIIALKDEIKEGQSLANALAQHKDVFDTIYIQLVRAGEATGKLDVILERLNEYIERRETIVKKVKGSLRYPMIQLGFVGLVTVAMMIFVVPKFAENFASMGKTLPLPTRILMTLSSFFISYWYVAVIIITILICLFLYWRSTARGGVQYDVLKLKLPIIGYFTRTGTIVQFSRTLGMLMESGVNLSEALDIVVSIVDNKVLAQELGAARDKIVKEGKIAEYLKNTGIFPPIATYLIKTGEESGQLDAMLLNVAKNYEGDLQEYADNLSSLLEPVMLVLMACVVGFIVAAIVAPMLGQISIS